MGWALRDAEGRDIVVLATEDQVRRFAELRLTPPRPDPVETDAGVVSLYDAFLYLCFVASFDGSGRLIGRRVLVDPNGREGAWRDDGQVAGLSFRSSARAERYCRDLLAQPTIAAIWPEVSPPHSTEIHEIDGLWLVSADLVALMGVGTQGEGGVIVEDAVEAEASDLLDVMVDDMDSERYCAALPSEAQARELARIIDRLCADMTGPVAEAELHLEDL